MKTIRLLLALCLTISVWACESSTAPTTPPRAITPSRCNDCAPSRPVIVHRLRG